MFQAWPPPHPTDDPPLSRSPRYASTLPRPPPVSLHLSPPHLTGQELAGLQAMLASGWVAPAGPIPAAFEAAVAAATGFSHVVAVASGTAALHLGFRCLQLVPGDEVWTSTMTFVASIAPAVQMGAVPRFLDVDRRSWTLHPGLLVRELARAAQRGRLPRVVVAPGIYGQDCDLPAILSACDRWGVPVLSDSAETLGARQHGRPAGHGARLAAFSFNGNKIVTAGGGGALASDDAELIEAARHLASQAKCAAPHYQHETTGHSYGMSSVLAAVGLAQLAVLEDRVAARRAIFARYRAGLNDIPGLAFMPEPAWARGTRWLTAVTFEPRRAGTDRELVRQALAEMGVESRPVWKPLHLQPVFAGAPHADGMVAAKLFEQGLCLPSGSAMTPAEQAMVVETIRGCCRV